MSNNTKGDNHKKLGFKQIDKFGENTDIDTGTVPECIWSVGGTIPYLANAIAMSIKSSAAADAAAGTGARTVLIQGYLDDNSFQQETVTLNGTSLVNLSYEYKAITRMVIQTSGSGNTNAGNIDIVDTATGTNTYQRIPIGEGQTLSAFQIVEKGKRGVIISHYVTYARLTVNQGSRLRLKVILSDGTTISKYNTTVDASKKKDNKEYANGGGISVDEGQWIFWECVEVTANDTPIEAGFTLQIWNK